MRSRYLSVPALMMFSLSANTHAFDYSQPSPQPNRPEAPASTKLKSDPSPAQESSPAVAASSQHRLYVGVRLASGKLPGTADLFIGNALNDTVSIEGHLFKSEPGTSGSGGLSGGGAAISSTGIGFATLFWMPANPTKLPDLSFFGTAGAALIDATTNELSVTLGVGASYQYSSAMALRFGTEGNTLVSQTAYIGAAFKF